MHTVFALLCFVVVIHWLIFPYPSGLLHWHCGNLTIAPVPAKQPWWIWINTSCELHNHNKTKHNKTVCIFLGIYCMISPGYDVKYVRRNLDMRLFRMLFTQNTSLNSFQCIKGCHVYIFVQVTQGFRLSIKLNEETEGTPGEFECDLSDER